MNEFGEDAGIMVRSRCEYTITLCPEVHDVDVMCCMVVKNRNGWAFEKL
jgi:hypothetical protein